MADSGIDTREVPPRRQRLVSRVRAILLFLLSVALVAYLVSKLDIGESLRTLARTSIPLALVCCLLYYTSNACKAFRLKLLLRDAGIRFGDLFVITSYHNFFNQIFPARSGELTLVYYLKKVGNMNVSRGLHSLIIIRIFDFAVVPLFFIVSFLVFFGKRTSPLLIVAAAGFFLLSLFLLFKSRWFVAAGRSMLHALFRLLRIDGKPSIARILAKVDEVALEFEQFDTWGHVTRLTFASLAVWAALYTLFYTAIRALGVSIDYFQAIAGSTGGVLANILPINSFGSFGTLEAGWAGGFMLVGMTRQDAIVTGIGFHLISFVASASIAILCRIAVLIRDRHV